jgi:Peptidoglycan-binding protein, CsiV
MKSALSSTAAALLAGAALAQAPQPPAQEPVLPPRYEVEILVFANRAFDPTEELFDYAPNGFGSDASATLLEPPVFDDTTLTAPPPSPAPVVPFVPVDPLEAARAEVLAVRPLRPEELKLGLEYRRLRAISAYEPLVHVGWVQPGLPEDDAESFDLKTLGIMNPRGTVRVHRMNYLHVTLDLTYQAPLSTTPAQSSVDGLDEIILAPRYRLTTTRRVSSGELHYFDHPAFGVLVRVTPVPTQDDGRRPAA